MFSIFSLGIDASSVGVFEELLQFLVTEREDHRRPMDASVNCQLTIVKHCHPARELVLVLAPLTPRRRSAP
jgi:hypothetical protein